MYNVRKHQKRYNYVACYIYVAVEAYSDQKFGLHFEIK